MKFDFDFGLDDISPVRLDFRRDKSPAEDEVLLGQVASLISELDSVDQLNQHGYVGLCDEVRDGERGFHREFCSAMFCDWRRDCRADRVPSVMRDHFDATLLDHGVASRRVEALVF